MSVEPPDPDVPSENAIPDEWLEGLRTFPSETVTPPGDTDAAVMAMARARLSPIGRRRWRQRLWPALGAAACVMLAFALFPRGRTVPAPQARPPAEDKYAVILREVSAVFPRQVKAIVSDGSELEINLSEKPMPGDEQPVVVEVFEKGGCKAVITYVGQTVEIDRHRLTVQADENGDIVIDGPDLEETGRGTERSAPDLLIKTRRI